MNYSVNDAGTGNSVKKDDAVYLFFTSLPGKEELNQVRDQVKNEEKKTFQNVAFNRDHELLYIRKHLILGMVVNIFPVLRD